MGAAPKKRSMQAAEHATRDELHQVSKETEEFFESYLKPAEKTSKSTASAIFGATGGIVGALIALAASHFLAMASGPITHIVVMETRLPAVKVSRSPLRTRKTSRS
jgi:hypothetical protein